MFFVWIYEMEQFKLNVFDFQPMGNLICLLVGTAIFIERALAIIQECNDHTDMRSLERLHC